MAVTGHSKHDPPDKHAYAAGQANVESISLRSCLTSILDVMGYRDTLSTRTLSISVSSPTDAAGRTARAGLAEPSGTHLAADHTLEQGAYRPVQAATRDYQVDVVALAAADKTEGVAEDAADMAAAAEEDKASVVDWLEDATVAVANELQGVRIAVAEHQEVIVDPAAIREVGPAGDAEADIDLAGVADGETLGQAVVNEVDPVEVVV